ncbi:MAG: hypothetical protein OEW58_11920 [Gammaproteobacteria bacterium]|nr:hypothetical protein [Gammaproteobacteria bacterium]
MNPTIKQKYPLFLRLVLEQQKSKREKAPCPLAPLDQAAPADDKSGGSGK